MNKLILILIFLFTGHNIFGQQSVTQGFPLKTGNIFKFKVSSWAFPNYNSTTYFQSSVTGEAIFNSKKYFFIPNYCGYENKWWRVDSLTGILFTYDTSGSCTTYDHEKMFDSLWAKKNERSAGCGSESYICNDTTDKSIFNSYYVSKDFDGSYFAPPVSINRSRRYMKGFGLVMTDYSTHYVGSTSGSSCTLIGCIIDGVTYGDVSNISINLLNNGIPDKYSLSQNYPNPFNPSTKINYEIKSSGFVSLKVFDLLGKEVAQIVNEKQTAGSYAVDFSSSEFNLPSGIYFYTLNAGEFKETKKMVLVK